jgi:hypothetical protein
MRVIGLTAVLAIGLLATLLVAETQQPKLPTIGVLAVGARSSGKSWRIFREALRQLGYVEGQTVRFEFRSDHAHRTPSIQGTSPLSLR